MKVVSGDLFRKADEEFRKDVSVIEEIEDKNLNWNNFKVGDIVINCKENCKKASINLDGGMIDGHLTINGFHQKLAGIKIIDIEAKKIAIYNLDAKKIEITGRVETIEIINSNVDDCHICGETEKSILLLRSGSRTSSFEINGYVETLKLRNIIANDFKIKLFNCNEIKGANIKIKELYLPTDWNSELKFIDVKELYLFRSGETTGTIYNLKNTTLKF